MQRYLTYILFISLFIKQGISTWSYYSYDGTGNNLIINDLGASSTTYLRTQIKAAYTDQGSTTYCQNWPDVREISNKLIWPNHLMDMMHVNATATTLLTYLGQFIIHDITDIKEGTEAYPIIIPYCDFNFDQETCNLDEGEIYPEKKTLNFFRSDFEIKNGHREQINMVSAYLDGSVIYGSDGDTASKLRSYVNGKMMTYNNQLPLNIMNIDMLYNPKTIENNAYLRAAGDRRANVEPMILALHSLFILEHNRLASDIKDLNPDLTDEEIYDRARKWNIAFLQKICYYEYLPQLGIQLPRYEQYKSHIDPGIDNFFAVVTRHYLDSQKKDIIYRLNEDNYEITGSHLLLHTSYFEPTESLSSGISPILRGSILSKSLTVSPFISEALRNYYYGPPIQGGSDLLSMILQRGRDHGIPNYSKIRDQLGLKEKLTLDDITSNYYLKNILKDIYENDLNQMDAYIGALAEDKFMNASIGEVFYMVMSDQFTRIRDGDRFYFEKEDVFTEEELNIIYNTNLRDIIIRNTDIETLPDNIYVYNEDWLIINETTAEADATNEILKAQETLQASVYTLYWQLEIINNIEYMVFTLECVTEGFVGIGIAKDETSGMVEADIIVVSVDDNGINVNDYWSDTFTIPKLDTELGGTDDVEVMSGSQENGITKVEFRRKIETGDAFDRDIRKVGETPIIYSWHTSSDELEYHTALRRGKRNIDFFGRLNSSLDNNIEMENLNINEGYDFSWTLIDTEISNVKWIEINIRYQSSGMSYVGFGIKEGTEIDYVIIDNSGRYCDINDYYYYLNEIKEDYVCDGNNDILDKSCSVDENNLIQAHFKRLIDTGDITDIPIINQYMDVVFIWDLDNNNEFSNNDTLRQKQFQIDFFNNPASPPILIQTEITNEITNESISDNEAGLTSNDDDNEIMTNNESSELLNVEFEENAYIELAEGYKVWYKIIEDTKRRKNNRKLAQDELSENSEIIIKLQRESSGWMAFGIDPADASINGMQETDMYIGWVDDSGTVTVIDAWAIGFMKPESDEDQGGTSDILEYAGEEIDGITTIVFKRKINTGDKLDRQIKNIEQDYVFAYGEGDELPIGGHGSCCRGKGKIEFTKDPETIENNGSEEVKGPWIPSRSLILSHAWLMTISWVILSVLGLTVSRLGRHWKHWETAHILLEIGATLISFVGEVVSIIYTKGMFRKAHGILSFFVLFGSLLQLGIGYLTYERRTVNLKKGHRAMGFFVFGVGMWQCWLGMKILELDVRLIQCFYAWIISSCVSFHFASEGTSYDEMKTVLIKTGILPDDFKDDNRKDQKKKENSEQGIQQRKSMAAAFADKIKAKLSIKGDINNNGNNELNTKEMSVDEFIMECQDGKELTMINGKVYDMSTLIERHPGGAESILEIIGKDGSEMYNTQHEDSQAAHRMLAKNYLYDITGDLSKINDFIEEDEHFTI